MDEEQQVGYLVSNEERARIEMRSAASDSLIQFQQGRIANLEVEVRRRDARLADRVALVEQLQQSIVDLTLQVADLGGQPPAPVIGAEGDAEAAGQHKATADHRLGVTHD